MRLELEDYRCKPRTVEVALVAVRGEGEHRGRKLSAYEVYEVTPSGRVLMGHVRESTETLERRTRGKTYVNARWTGARTIWRASSRSLDRMPAPRRTRQDAIAVLFGMSRARRAT